MNRSKEKACKINLTFFDKLAPELQTKVAKKLSTSALVHLARTPHYHLALFQPLIDAHKPVTQLLHHVVRAEYDTVQSILKNEL